MIWGDEPSLRQCGRFTISERTATTLGPHPPFPPFLHPTTTTTTCTSNSSDLSGNSRVFSARLVGSWVAFQNRISLIFSRYQVNGSPRREARGADEACWRTRHHGGESEYEDDAVVAHKVARATRTPRTQTHTGRQTRGDPGGWGVSPRKVTGS